MMIKMTISVISLSRFRGMEASAEDIFQSLDRNLDGELSVEEFETALDR